MTIASDEVYLVELSGRILVATKNRATAIGVFESYFFSLQIAKCGDFSVKPSTKDDTIAYILQVVYKPIHDIADCTFKDIHVCRKFDSQSRFTRWNAVSVDGALISISIVNVHDLSNNHVNPNYISSNPDQFQQTYRVDRVTLNDYVNNYGGSTERRD